MAKRESLKNTTERIENIGKKGFISLGLSLLSLVFALPIGETLFGSAINVQLWASIVSALCFIYFLYWVYLEVRRIYLVKTMKYEVYISGDTSRVVPEIKIENKEPVKIQDIYIEMIRFNWNKSNWNDIDKFKVGDRFFSVGFSEDRSVAKSPVYIKVAELIKNPNLTAILLDNQTLHMPLDKTGNEFSRWAKYEFVFRITGRFADKDESESFGDFRGVLIHEQIQPHGKWAGQDVFKWEVFEKTDEKIESALKLEREKELGFSFT